MAQRVSAIFPSREEAQRAADALVDLGAEREHISMLARGGDRDVTATTPAAHHDSDRSVTTPMADVRDTDRSGRVPPSADVGVDATATGAHRGGDFVEPARRVGDAGAPMTTADEDDAAQGAAEGAAIGAAVGIALGVASLLVPGIGLVLASGPLAWAIGGAVGTAVAGAITGGVYGSLRDIGIEERYARGYEERIRSGDVLLTALVPTGVSEDRILDVLSEHNAEDISFADDTSIAQSAVSSPQPEAQILSPDYQTAQPGDRDYAIAAQPEERTMPTTAPAAGAPDTPIDAPAGMGSQAAGAAGSGAAGMASSTMPSASAFGGPANTTGIGASDTAGLGAADLTAPSAAGTFGSTSMPASTGAVAGTGTAGASGFNEESSLAGRSSPPGATAASPTTSSTEASASRMGGNAAPPMSATGASASPTTSPIDADMRTGASYAESPVGSIATDGAELNVARGEAKQMDGERRDQAADRAGSPMENLAAKGEKAEGHLQEKLGEAEETIEPRRV